MSTAHGDAISLATAGSFQTLKIISRDGNAFPLQSRNSQFVATLEGSPRNFLSSAVSKSESQIRYKASEPGRSLLDIRTLKWMIHSKKYSDPDYLILSENASKEKSTGVFDCTD
eukprot:763397-Hanusia_phi.AAC.2